MSEKKKVLIITRNFPPLTGGMEKLLWKVYQGLKNDYECTVIGPPGCKEFLGYDRDHVACRSHGMGGFVLEAARQALVLTHKQRFDLVIGGSGVVAPVLLLMQRLRRVKTSCFVHGLDLVVNNMVYQMFFVPCLQRLSGVICNSANTAKLAESKGIRADRVSIIHPGVDDKAISTTTRSLRKAYGIGNAPFVLSAGRLIKRKGVLPFVANCLPGLAKRYPQIKFVVIGGEPLTALKKEKPATQAIMEAARQKNVENNLLMLGETDEETLVSAYAEADLFVFPLIDVPGDVEGFGMVAAEAAALGLPTVAFNCGGVSDAVIDGETGWLVEPENYAKMAKVVADCIEHNEKDQMHENCIKHAQSLSWDNFNNRLRSHIEAILATI